MRLDSGFLRACIAVATCTALLTAGVAAQVATQDPQASLFDSFDPGGPTLVQRAATATGDVMVMTGGFEPIPGGTVVGKKPVDFIDSCFCDADLVVIGTPEVFSSQLTASGRFAYTDYTTRIAQILKNDPAARLEDGSVILISRPGGVLNISGHQVLANVAFFPLFELGRAYVFFLRRIPGTPVYRAFTSGTFVLSGDNAVPVGKRSPEEARGGTRKQADIRSRAQHYLDSGCAVDRAHSLY